jgi:hypothetical protein
VNPTELTPKARKFAELIVAGKSSKDAYLEAYDADAMKTTTVYSRSCELRKEPRVVAYIAELQGLTLGNALTPEGSTVWDKQEVVAAIAFGKRQWNDELYEIVRMSVRAEEFGPAIKGMELLGKANGFLEPEKTEVNVNNNTLVVQQEDKWAKLKSLLPAL